jgi:hypothetical protein
MESVSFAGLIGAALGLAIGYVDYRVVGGVVEARLRKLDRSATPAERETFERKVRLFRWIFLVMTVGAFPVVGYLVGATIAGG